MPRSPKYAHRSGAGAGNSVRFSMSKTHLRQLWTAIGAILTFYSMNAWLVSQGGNAIFDVKLLDNRPRVESLFAVPICSIALFALCQIGVAYAKKSGGGEWHSRLPVVWLESLETSSVGGRRYQAFFLAIFIFVPAVALIHFLRKVFEATVLRDGNQVEALSPLDAVPPSQIFSETYWIGDGLYSGMAPIVGAVAWIPVIEPVLLVLLVLAAWMAVVRLIWFLFHET